MHWLLNHNYNRQSIGFNVQMNFIQFMNKTKSKSNNKVIINRVKFLQRIPRQLAIQRFIPIPAFYAHLSVLSPFQHFIRNSAFYPHFSVLFHFSVLSPFQRFIIPNSAFYPHFSFRFSHSVSAFYPDPPDQGLFKNKAIHTHTHT